MEEQEAMERIKSILYEATTDKNAVCYVTDYDETPLKIAIKSLEKQIPIKPIGSTNICPKCQDVEFGFNEPKYCPNCGQAIKWEDNA